MKSEVKNLKKKNDNLGQNGTELFGRFKKKLGKNWQNCLKNAKESKTGVKPPKKQITSEKTRGKSRSLCQTGISFRQFISPLFIGNEFIPPENKS